MLEEVRKAKKKQMGVKDCTFFLCLLTIVTFMDVTKCSHTDSRVPPFYEVIVSSFTPFKTGISYS